MVDSNYYVENPANNFMHNGNKPLVGVVDFPNRLPINRPYNYFDAQATYYNLQNDIWQKQKIANPQNVKKGVPKIIKIAAGTLLAIPLLFCGYKGIQKLIAKFKH